MIRALTASSPFIPIDGELTRLDGIVLLLGGVGYTAGLVQISRRSAADPAEDVATVAQAAGRHRPVRQGLLLVGAIAVVVIGAELLVNGAVASARSLGVSDAVIGLTIIAIGTSAPELVTTVVSTVRGARFRPASGGSKRIELISPWRAGLSRAGSTR